MSRLQRASVHRRALRFMHQLVAMLRALRMQSLNGAVRRGRSLSRRLPRALAGSQTTEAAHACPYVCAHRSAVDRRGGHFAPSFRVDILRVPSERRLEQKESA